MGVDEYGGSRENGGGVFAVESVEVSGAERARKVSYAVDGVDEELLSVVVDSLGVGIVDEHLGGNATDIGTRTAVHVLGLFDHDDTLADVGKHMGDGLASLPEPDNYDVC